VDPELSALTSTAANTVVQLLATTAWEQATSLVSRLWRRAHPECAQEVQAELEGSRAELLAARQVGDERIEQVLVEQWRDRLRYLADANPQLVDELRHVVTRWGSMLAQADPPRDATIMMRTTTFGDSRVNQAGRDLHIAIRE
jgi:malate synthase